MRNFLICPLLFGLIACGTTTRPAFKVASQLRYKSSSLQDTIPKPTGIIFDDEGLPPYVTNFEKTPVFALGAPEYMKKAVAISFASTLSWINTHATEKPEMLVFSPGMLHKMAINYADCTKNVAWDSLQKVVEFKGLVPSSQVGLFCSDNIIENVEQMAQKDIKVKNMDIGGLSEIQLIKSLRHEINKKSLIIVELVLNEKSLEEFFTVSSGFDGKVLPSMKEITLVLTGYDDRQYDGGFMAYHPEKILWEISGKGFLPYKNLATIFRKALVVKS
ncbi:MAG: hypothetical protein J0L94_04230 [Rhodothermia bacterium]|nr:hypothetical protein [Rhodothermia bacterium]